MCKKILIVDDDNGFVYEIINNMINKDYSVSVAYSLSRAENILKDCNFDIILANYKIPGGNSMTLKNLTPSDTKFYFMSNIDSDSEYIKKCGELFFYKQDISYNLDKVFINA